MKESKGKERKGEKAGMDWLTVLVDRKAWRKRDSKGGNAEGQIRSYSIHEGRQEKKGSKTSWASHLYDGALY